MSKDKEKIVETATKGIADYLHLYLGCPVMTNLGKGKLSGVNSCGTSGSLYFLIMDEDSGFVEEADLEYMQLILRPLSGITKEECIEIYKLVVPSSIGMEQVHMSEMGRLFVVYRDNSPTKDCITNIIPYLLRQGFDLFGLIPAGLAISSLTPNTPSND